MNESTATAGIKVLEALMQNTQKTLKGLITENNRLRDVVGYYASQENWRTDGECIARFDRGKKARDCIKSLNICSKARGEITRICE